MVLQRGRAESLRSRTNDTHSSDSAEVGWSAATPPLGRGSVASRASCRMCCICSLLQLVKSWEAPALVSCVDPRSNSVFFCVTIVAAVENERVSFFSNHWCLFRQIFPVPFESSRLGPSAEVSTSSACSYLSPSDISFSFYFNIVEVFWDKSLFSELLKHQSYLWHHICD